MKKLAFHTALLFIASSAVLSCSRQANLKSEFEEQKRVINCLFADGDNFKVYTTLTATPIDTSLMVSDTLAEVRLFEDNVYKETLPYNRIAAFYNSTTIAKLGKRYRIEVRNPSLTNNLFEANASAALPDSFSVFNASFKDSFTTDAFGNWLGKIHFEIPYAAGLINPELTLEYYDAVNSSYSPVLSFTPDNNWKRYAINSIATGSYTINNEDWGGLSKGFDLLVSSLDYRVQNQTVFRIGLSNLSSDWRNYQTSLTAYLKANGADQLQLFSNVNGGYGIFAGKSVNKVIVK